MEVKIAPSILDPIPSDMFDAFNNIVATDHPCKVCKAAKTNIRDHYHGSDLGACPRKVAYKMLTPSANRSFNSSSMFLQDGHLHEKTIIDALRENLPDNYRIQAGHEIPEFKWKIGDMYIHCHVDGLMHVDNDGEITKYLIECKSVKETTWKKVQGGEISDEWYGQIQSYLAGLKLEAGYLCVKHRHTSQLMMPIRIDKDMDFIESSINGLLEIQAVRTPDKVTRKHDTAKASECVWCPFKEECWNG